MPSPRCLPLSDKKGLREICQAACFDKGITDISEQATLCQFRDKSISWDKQSRIPNGNKEGKKSPKRYAVNWKARKRKNKKNKIRFFVGSNVNPAANSLQQG